jgi:uncharacterized protein YidB (DUF937 family)
MSPMTMALLGVLAYRTLHGKGRLAEMLGGAQSTGAQSGGIAPTLSGSLGSQTGGLGSGLLSGILGGSGLSAGIGDLLSQFQNAGHGEKAQSWVGSGPNKEVAPNEIEQVLGPEKIGWLQKETGLSREDLLSGLSRELPAAVDQLTPDGRVPSPDEASRLLT